MRYSFRLAELLGHMPDPRRRPGTIKAIVEHTGLDRHQVAALLKNEVKYIPLRALSRLCDYLIEHGYVSPDDLPGALFAVEPEDFWELLARRRRLELCLGVRKADKKDWPEGAWVVASDSLLLGALLNGVSTLGGTSPLKSEGTGRATEAPPHPEHLKQSLVWAPGQTTDDQVSTRATDVYQQFDEARGDKGLIGLGSVKSNPVVEMIFANAFGCEPFVSADDSPSARKRPCPIFLRYRPDDPHPPSCSAGMQLARNHAADQPGFHYEQDDGSWGCVAWDGKTQDAALLFYIHREAQGRLEVAAGGFSGRATRLLARTLATRAAEFWPPTYNRHGVQVGAFLIQYTFSGSESRTRDILESELGAAEKIIAVSSKVIERRLER